MTENSHDVPGELAGRAEVEHLCLRNLMSTQQDRIFFKDRESRFLLVSEGWLAAVGLGLSLEQVIGKTDFDFFTGPHAVAAREDEQRIMRTGDPVLARTGR